MPREPSRIFVATPSRDGAGVSLKRVFAYRERGLFDPFLLLDHFGSDNPADYLPGFPWHPHRGIETVTYMLSGIVEHGDSLGNSGTIGRGEAQWMTAGSGIIHQEMPKEPEDRSRLEGFQLWIDLPASMKLCKPRYRAIEPTAAPRISDGESDVKLLAGEFEGKRGPTPDLMVPVLYLLAELKPGARRSFSIPAAFNAGVYLYRGSAMIGARNLHTGNAALLPPSGEAQVGATDSIELRADPSAGASLLLFAGKPLRQPIAWGGPIVMNTRDELDQAFRELDEGTFLRDTPEATRS